MPNRNRMELTGQGESTIAPYEPARPGIDALLGRAEGVLNAGPAAYYPGGTVAGLGQGTQDALGVLRNTAGTTSATEQFLAANDAGGGVNPHLRGLLDMGAEQIGNQVRAAYGANGRYGSEAFTNALTRGISNFQTPLLFNAYEGDQNRRLQGAGMLDANRYTDSNALLTAGGIEDQASQLQRDDDVARYQWEHGGGERDLIDWYGGTPTGIAATFGRQTQTQSEPRRPIRNFFRGLIGGLGALGSVVSDERAKEDIEPVGKLDDGQTVYRYRYKAGGPVQIGLLAQEVQRKKPEAVRVNAGGILSVDYGLATEDAAA